MARKSTRRGSATLNTTAESIGAALGLVAAKLDRWKAQRTEIAADIQKVLQSAQAMMGDLGEAAGRGAGAFTGAASPKGGRPKGYKMSEATKRKLRAAWRRRKAAGARKTASPRKAASSGKAKS
jgi:hypothetical protein